MARLARGCLERPTIDPGWESRTTADRRVHNSIYGSPCWKAEENQSNTTIESVFYLLRSDWPASFLLQSHWPAFCWLLGVLVLWSRHHLDTVSHILFGWLNQQICWIITVILDFCGFVAQQVGAVLAASAIKSPPGSLQFMQATWFDTSSNPPMISVSLVLFCCKVVRRWPSRWSSFIFSTPFL